MTSLNIVFTSTDEPTCGLYYKHFREVPGIKVRQCSVLEGEECLVLPMPSCFGLYGTKSGFVNNIMKVLGPQVADMIRDHVLRKYLGEQPVGSAFILKNPTTSTKFKYIVVVAVFRALTCKGDDMAWLDPVQVHQDFCYNAMRGALLRILKHNVVSKTKITTVYCPDFFQLKREAPGPEIGPREADDAVKQMLLACRSILEPSTDLKDWPSAILLTSQIIKTNQEDIEDLLHSGALEARGIYSKEELDLVMGWARDSKDLVKQETALKVLAACLHRRDTQFNLPKRDIARMISSQREGCLPMMLSKVLQHKLTIHTELLIEELHFGNKLGLGGAGVVYRGTWQDKTVAIKEFTKEVAKEDMLKELSIMCLVQHPNLVKCHGGITQGRMLIVQELMQCNLADALAEPSIKIDLGNVCQIAVQAAQGIDFLHTHCNLIHRDLKSPNILLIAKDEIEAKITDFGASRVLNTKSSMTGNVGTVAWIAPEVFGQRKYNEKCDIYSFGIILWELLSRQIPFSNMSTFTIPMNVMKGERPPLKKEYPAPLQKLIKDCWNAKPQKRPTLQQAIFQLKRFHSGLKPQDKMQATLDLQKLNTPQHLQLKPLSPTPSSPTKDTTSCGGDSTSKDTDESLSQSEDKTLTCSVPSRWTRYIAKAESKHNTIMSSMGHDLEQGKIVSQKERFILVRANSFMKDLPILLKRELEFDASISLAQFCLNFRYDLGFSIGRQTCQGYQSKAPSLIEDKITKLMMCYVHMAYAGFSFVNLLPTSNFVSNVIITEHPVSFESDSFLADEKKKSKVPVCCMSGGYLAGWATQIIGEPMSTVEVTCRSRGDPQCLFVTAPTGSYIESLTEFCSSQSLSLESVLSYARIRLTDYSPTDKSTVKLRTSRSFSTSEVFSKPQLSPEEIDVKVDSCLQNFYLDPSSATIELANQKCLMLQESVLTKGLYSFIMDLMEFKSSDQKGIFAPSSELKYFLGKCFGASNSVNFCEQLSIGSNGISKALAISANFAYNGWSSFRILKGLDQNELSKDDFLVVCSAQHSFEAEAWLANKKNQNVPKTVAKRKRFSLNLSLSQEKKLETINEVPGLCVCAMHAGYISGWFEESFQRKCSVVEVRCVASGARRCEFYIAHPDSIHKFTSNFESIDYSQGKNLSEIFVKFTYQNDETHTQSEKSTKEEVETKLKSERRDRDKEERKDRRGRKGQSGSDNSIPFGSKTS